MGDWSHHGGRIAAAARAFGGQAEDWLDLSTGINPIAWPGAASLAIDWRGLPDDAALRALEEAAAAMFEADPAFVCALPGTEIGLRLIGQAIGEGAAVHVAPAYRTHGAMLGGTAPIAAEEVAAERAAGRTVILANPNNPDGRLIAADTIGALADGAGWLIVDEAFADAHPAASVAGQVEAGRRLIVFRSFGKFFGLAGVRLGFVIAPPAVLAAVRALLGSWPVSVAALAIGTAAYRDHRWIAETRAALPARAAALDGVLARHGLGAGGACPLFRLVERDEAGPLFARLARHAILTRPFDHDPRWLRFGVPGDAAALERLDRALALG